MPHPRFVISKPTTSHDAGTPTESCHGDAERIFRFIEDERHLVANSLYQSVKDRIREYKAPKSSRKLRFRRSQESIIQEEKGKDIQAARELLFLKKEVLAKLEKRAQLLLKARDSLVDDGDWSLAQTLFGVTTYYRRELDGSLSIKMEGSIEGVSLFDQVCVLREVDLHYKWAPFVSSSLTIEHLDKLDTVGWLVVGLPSFGLLRDACFRAIGCDSMLEDGSILLVGKGIDDKPLENPKRKKKNEADTQEVVAEYEEFDYLAQDPELKELDLPERPKGFGAGRMTIRSFRALIHVESPMSAKTRIIANVDPNLPFLPQSLLDFAMKKLCGVLLYKLQNAAKKVSKDPIYNPHASKMRQEEDFYKKWLMEKFNAVCEIRRWTMPPVLSLELTDQQKELALVADEKRNKPKKNSTIKYYHSLSGDNLDDYLHQDNSQSEPAQIGSPKVRTLPGDGDSLVSDISRNSSSDSLSVWRRNPIATYLRGVEEKKKLRKARDIQKARERAGNRLKPKALDPTETSRLKELQSARKRRLAGMPGKKTEIPQDATKSQRRLITTEQRKDWATFWAGHGLITRIVVLVVTIASLFAVLYLDTVLRRYVAIQYQDWSVGVKRDMATVLHMVLSAAVHFSMCYIALMYEFSSLRIGSVAGKKIRGYYSGNIHVLVGTASFGMVFLGMLKAVALLFSRWLVWKMILVPSWVVLSFWKLQRYSIEMLPENVVSGVSEFNSLCVNTTSSALETFSSIIGYVTGFCSTIYGLLVESNIVGRSVSAVVVAVIRPLFSTGELWRAFVKEAVDCQEGRLEAKGWSEDAFEATRALLTYSGVFLLFLLLLFNFIAVDARNRVDSAEVTVATDGSESTKSDSSLGTQQAIHQSEGFSRQRTPSATSDLARPFTPKFDTIKETTDEGHAVDSLPGIRSDGGAPVRKQRLRRGKKRTGERPGARSLSGYEHRSTTM